MTDLSYTTTARVLAKMDRSAAEIRAALIDAGANPESADRSISKCRQEGLLPPHQFRQTFRAHGVTFVAADAEPIEDLPLRSEQRELTKAKRNTLLHLLDLKRAGHSPRFTELNIPTDLNMPAAVAAGRKLNDHRSFCGSAAAMCAGF